MGPLDSWKDLYAAGGVTLVVLAFFGWLIYHPPEWVKDWSKKREEKRKELQEQRDVLQRELAAERESRRIGSEQSREHVEKLNAEFQATIRQLIEKQSGEIAALATSIRDSMQAVSERNAANLEKVLESSRKQQQYERDECSKQVNQLRVDIMAVRDSIRLERGLPTAKRKRDTDLG